MMGGARPYVSVVVPTYRRPEALDRCLGSLDAQDYPRDRFEVIVVDDHGGAVPLSGIVSRHDVRATLLSVPHLGPAGARNRAAARAQGTVLAFLDDDCIADPHWLTALVEVIGRHPESVIGGRVALAGPANAYVRASQTLLTFLYRYYHEQQRGLLPFFTTNNLAAAASVFARGGGFDETFPFASEDREWSDRMRHDGHALVYAPEAVVYHAPHLTFAGFVRQHFRYGEGAWRFHGSRRRLGRTTGVEAPAFYLGMLGAPFSLRDPQPLRQSILLLASQLIAAAGFVRAALGHRMSARPSREPAPPGESGRATSS